MMGGDGVEVKYDEVGSSMGGMARLRRIAASGWAGVSCACVSWARMLFSARVDGIGPFSSSDIAAGIQLKYLPKQSHHLSEIRTSMTLGWKRRGSEIQDRKD